MCSHVVQWHEITQLVDCVRETVAKKPSKLGECG